MHKDDDSTPNLERRIWLKVAPLIVLAIQLPTLIGCTILDQLSTWIPVGIDAANAILLVLDPAAAIIATPFLGLVKVGFADLAAAVDDYENAPASAKATLLGKIKTLLADIANHFQNMLTALAAIPGFGLVAGLVTLILNMLAYFSQQLGITGAIPAQLMLAGRPVVTVTPTKRTVPQFQSAYNTALAVGGHSNVHIPLEK